MIPRVVLADFHPQADTELAVLKGQLVLQLHADITEAGWAEVAPADAIDPIEAGRIHRGTSHHLRHLYATDLAPATGRPEILPV